MKSTRAEWIKGYEAVLRDLETPGRAATAALVKGLRFMVRERLDILKQEQQEETMLLCPWCRQKDKRQKNYKGDDAVPEETCLHCGHRWTGWLEWQREDALARVRGVHG